MTLLQVINLAVANHPYLSLIGFLGFTAILAQFTFLCWNRFLRCLSIRKAGWPPPHCNADGDSTTDTKDDNDE